MIIFKLFFSSTIHHLSKSKEIGKSSQLFFTWIFQFYVYLIHSGKFGNRKTIRDSSSLALFCPYPLFNLSKIIWSCGRSCGIKKSTLKYLSFFLTLLRIHMYHRRSSSVYIKATTKHYVCQHTGFHLMSSLFVCLVGFLTSSSTTRLYCGRAPRQSV